MGHRHTPHGRVSGGTRSLFNGNNSATAAAEMCALLSAVLVITMAVCQRCAASFDFVQFYNFF